MTTRAARRAVASAWGVLRLLAAAWGGCAALANAAGAQGAATRGAPERAELDAYDLREGRGTQLKLPHELREVSGLAVTGDGRLLAHGDERGVVYELDPRRGTVVKAFSLGTPPPRDDFEGIAVAGARVFLVTSGGRLYETREGADGAAVPFTVRDTGLGAACEIEGLAYEPADGTLIVPCKRPRGAGRQDAALRGSVTLFRWSLARNALAAPPRVAAPVAAVVRGTGLTAFHPSSVERAPRTGHYVIVAGPQHALVEVTAAGVVVAVRELSARAHPQPEGITFVGDSTLLIADEGGSKRGTLTAYRRVR